MSSCARLELVLDHHPIVQIRKKAMSLMMVKDWVEVVDLTEIGGTADAVPDMLQVQTQPFTQ